MHWAERAKWKSAWERSVWEAWLTVRNDFIAYLKLMPFELAEVELYLFRVSPMDTDNAWGSVKGIIDGLVKVGILRDDSYKHAVVGLEQVKVEKKEGERVEIVIKAKKYAKLKGAK